MTFYVSILTAAFQLFLANGIMRNKRDSTDDNFFQRLEKYEALMDIKAFVNAKNNCPIAFMTVIQITDITFTFGALYDNEPYKIF